MPVGYHIAFMFTNQFLAKTLMVVVVLLLFPEVSGGSRPPEWLCMYSAG